MYNNNYLDKNKFFYKDFKALKELEKTLFHILISIPADSFKNKKYVELAKFLVQGIIIWKPMPAFPIYLDDISIEIKRELMQLAEPELYVLMNNLLDRLFKYSLRKEKAFHYKYFVEGIRNHGLLKWELRYMNYFDELKYNQNLSIDRYELQSYQKTMSDTKRDLYDQH